MGAEIKNQYLEAVASLGLLADNIEDRVDELSAFGVVSLSPVVSCSRLSEHEVVGSEDLSERSGSDGVHGTGLQVDKYGTGDVFSTGCLVVVDIDPFQLEVGVSVVGTSGVDTMLVRDNLRWYGITLLVIISQNLAEDGTHRFQ